jgi:hypothetical protein
VHGLDFMAHPLYIHTYILLQLNDFEECIKDIGGKARRKETTRKTKT